MSLAEMLLRDELRREPETPEEVKRLLVSRLSSACTIAMRCSMLVHATTSSGSDVES
jgi:hypothetical protein